MKEAIVSAKCAIEQRVLISLASQHLESTEYRVSLKSRSKLAMFRTIQFSTPRLFALRRSIVSNVESQNSVKLKLTSKGKGIAHLFGKLVTDLKLKDQIMRQSKGHRLYHLNRILTVVPVKI